MTVYNLPPFGPRAAFPPPGAGAVGAWQPTTGSLAELAKSLHVGDDVDQAGVGAIRSVPDPWAQVRAFADAILTDHPRDHPLHEVSIAQWRGLLAVFGLQGVYASDYTITLTPVRLGRQVGEVGADTRTLFSRVLTRLTPPIVLQQTGAVTASWNQPVVVMLQPSGGKAQPIPLGVLNPSCLVAMGRMTAAARFAPAPWLANGVEDPTALEESRALPAEQYYLLAQWVSRLSEALERITDNRTPSALVKALSNYRADCLARVDDVEALNQDFKVAFKGATAFPGELPALYETLTAQLVLESIKPPEQTSECLIQFRDDLAANCPFKGIVLLDPQITGSLPNKKRAQDVVLWGNKRLSGVTEGSSAMRELASEMAEAGYFLATPHDLFTARLSKLLHKPLIKAHQGAASEYLLPLSPLALLLYPAAELADATTITEQSGRVTVSLKLTLANGGQHTVTRRYADTPKGDEGAIDREVDWALTDTAVWPDFRSPGWRWNFLRISYPADGEGLRARFGLSGAALSTMLGEVADPELASNTLKTWSDDTRCVVEKAAPFTGRSASSSYLSRLRNFSNSRLVEEYQTTPFGIEAVFFGRVPDGGTEMVAAGCALLKMKEPELTSTAGKVAIDFGTTNTIACFEDQTPITFKNRIVHPITSKDQGRKDRGEQQIRWPFVEFLPPADRAMPTPSVALSRNADDPKVLAGLRNNDLGPTFKSVVYFDPGEGSADAIATKDSQNFGDILHRARFNLKWSEDEDDQIYAYEYLRQLVMMCAAEALEKKLSLKALEWRFSKPDAMRLEQIQTIHQNLQLAVSEVAPGGEVPAPFSEGEAAANYILSGGKSGGFNRGLLNIIIDIGGGTTDVAFWTKPTDDGLVWSGSYKLAGGQFFTDYLMNNPDFFRRFGLDTWADIVNPQDQPSNISQKDLRSLGELLFSSPLLGEKLNSGWNMKNGTPEAKGLQRVALTFLGGIAWHLGVVAKVLIAQGKLEAESLDSVAFALCGRGSGLFSRLHLGPGGAANPMADTRISRLLTIFHRAAVGGGDDQRSIPRPAVFVSPTPKTEVCCGMVSMERPTGATRKRSFEPAGLTIPLGGDSRLSAEDDIIAAGSLGKIGYPSMDEFRNFLDAMASCAGLRLNLKDGDNQGALARARTKVFDEIQKSSSGLLEPPFISALRALVADLARSERERAAYLSADDVLTEAAE